MVYLFEDPSLHWCPHQTQEVSWGLPPSGCVSSLLLPILPESRHSTLQAESTWDQSSGDSEGARLGGVGLGRKFSPRLRANSVWGWEPGLQLEHLCAFQTPGGGAPWTVAPT